MWSRNFDENSRWSLPVKSVFLHLSSLLLQSLLLSLSVFQLIVSLPLSPVRPICQFTIKVKMNVKSLFFKQGVTSKVHIFKIPTILKEKVKNQPPLFTKWQKKTYFLHKKGKRFLTNQLKTNTNITPLYIIINTLSMCSLSVFCYHYVQINSLSKNAFFLNSFSFEIRRMTQNLRPPWR